MKDISKILGTLGFLDSEIKTYVSALSNGPSTVIELTKLTRLSRQATYVAIETLTDRGLMTSVVRGKKRYYQAEHPEKLLDYAKRRKLEVSEHVKDLERIVPDLELAIGGDGPMVKLFEGKDGLRAVLNEVKASKPKKVIEITDLDAMYSTLTTEDLSPLKNELNKIGTETMGIYYGELKGVRDAAKIVHVEKDLDFKTDITITENKVVMITFKGKMYSVIVDSKPLADTLRFVFESAFENLKRKK